jgi:hypothetical protein
MTSPLLFAAMWCVAGAALLALAAPAPAAASTNISATTNQHWGWNDIIGWIDFYNTQSIIVNSSQLTGYASSSIGYISFDCATTPIGNICSTQNGNYKVTNNGAGTLAGWAWNDRAGWISFSCTNNNGCANSNYGVYIDSSGNFQGYAWSDSIGWISFNCLGISSSFCTNVSNYEVATTWRAAPLVGMLDSATFDTGSTAGAQLNSVIWQGMLNGLPIGSVGFQFAASNNSSGPWNFTGPDGTASTTYAGNPGAPIPITNYSAYSGFRYFRYRLIMESNSSQNITPQVTGVSVNWSP